MIFNYFKTAIRNFKRNLLFSIINVVGLAIGISASLVIYLIVHYDFGIALVTIAFNSVKAAIANPVKSLKSE